MKASEENEALTNFLKMVTKDENLVIQNADGRLGKKYAIAEKSDIGTINVKSNFMTYNEMNCFFMGVLAVKENRINFS